MTGEPRQSPARYDKVVISSGHMIDAPDRPAPRFPAFKADAVRAEIARQLALWEIGESDLAICGGASGGDILFAEECARRGARLRLFLAQGADDFVRESVQPAGEEWVRRFHGLHAGAEVQTLSEALDAEPDDLSIYARVNLQMIENAQGEAANGGKLYALLVWDEEARGDGPGGTADFESRVRQLGAGIAIINPLSIR